MSASRLSSEHHRQLTRYLLICLATLVGLLGPCGRSLAGYSILMVLSDGGDAYQEAVRGFRETLRERAPIRVGTLEAVAAADLRPPPGVELLVVPVGMRAARFVAENLPVGVSVLALLVPKQSFAAIVWPAGSSRRHISAVYLDQPLQRSFQLIHLLDPRLKRVGIVVSEPGYSADDGGTDESLREAQGMARGHGLSLVTQVVDNGRGVADALRRLLPTVDVLMLVPDRLVINSANVQHVLLTSYRYRVPVMGFSQGLVTAGAVAAVFSTPEHIGQEGGRMAGTWAGGGDLPAARHAGGFDLAINERVTHSLGLAPPDERLLRRRLAGER